MIDRVFRRNKTSAMSCLIYIPAKNFVEKRGKLNIEKIKAIPNLFEAEIGWGECEYYTLENLDLTLSGRELEVRLAIAISLVFPQYKVGLTRSRRDSGVDIVVETDDGFVFIDTKESDDTDDKVSYGSLRKLEEFGDWVLYKAPLKDRSGNRGPVSVLSVRHLLMNMSQFAMSEKDWQEKETYADDIKRYLTSISA